MTWSKQTRLARAVVRQSLRDGSAGVPPRRRLCKKRAMRNVTSSQLKQGHFCHSDTHRNAHVFQLLQAQNRRCDSDGCFIRDAGNQEAPVRETLSQVKQVFSFYMRWMESASMKQRHSRHNWMKSALSCQKRVGMPRTRRWIVRLLLPGISQPSS